MYCGRPLYDYGFLGLAERYLRRTLDVLPDEIPAGTPIVGMEPSCLAVFKHELGETLPHDDDARRLAGCAMHFSEFFEKFSIPVPALERRALVWGHCHHKATGGMDPTAGRRALHVAQVLKMAREHGPEGFGDGPPERPYYEVKPRPPLVLRAARVAVPLAVLGAGLGALGAAVGRQG